MDMENEALQSYPTTATSSYKPQKLFGVFPPNFSDLIYFLRTFEMSQQSHSCKAKHFKNKYKLDLITSLKKVEFGNFVPRIELNWLISTKNNKKKIPQFLVNGILKISRQLNFIYSEMLYFWWNSSNLLSPSHKIYKSAVIKFCFLLTFTC